MTGDVLGHLGKPGDPSKLANALVSMEGIPEEALSRQGSIPQRATVGQLRGRSAGDRASAGSALRSHSMRSLWLSAGQWNGHKVRIRGVVRSQPRRIPSCIEDQWGAIECRLAHPQQFATGAAVEAEGYPILRRPQVRPRQRDGRDPPSPAGSCQRHRAPPASPRAHQRESGAQPGIRLRPPRAWPVRLQGVITYNDPMWRQLWMYDGTGGIFLEVFRGPSRVSCRHTRRRCRRHPTPAILRPSW